MSRWSVLLAAGALGLVALAQGPAAKQLYVVTHVDTVPGSGIDTVKEVTQFAADSKKDAGCVRFEALRSVERMNHFELVEVWRTRQDFEAHVAQEHTKRFREKIQPALGSPFDERLYNSLE